MSLQTSKAVAGRRHYYPVFLDLRGRRCVVIGSGQMVIQKVKELADAGARVTVITAERSSGPEELLADRPAGIEVSRRPFRPDDLQDAFLAIVAADPATNREVWAEAERRGIPVNAVDDLPHCSFIAPAIHRQGELTVAISTAGRAPALGVRLRDRIAALIGPEYARLLDLLGAARDRVAAAVPDFEARRKLWYRIVDSNLVELLRQGRPDAATSRLDELIAGDPPRRDRTGVVYLVGAGPGDPDLITVKGLGVLRQANVVIYDRLVHPALLNHAPQAERIFVGDLAGDYAARQDQINRLLVAHARRGRVVVRLKGGDPFVFGRGAEECEVLHEAGVRFDVIPGVSAAIAAPAAAGIPVTHRRFASAFAVVTGHESDGASDLDWEALARIPTLVVLMGLRSLEQIAERLIASGADPATPAAVIANGTRHDQQTVVGTLATIHRLSEEAGLVSPATLIVGDVVRVRELIGFADLPHDAAALMGAAS